MSKQKKSDFKRKAAFLLIAALLAGIQPMSRSSQVQAADYGVCSPRIDSSDVVTTTWDCIWFGKYWQEDTNGDGRADKNDEKTPIKWRVLSVDGDDAFLVADKNLDCQKYNDIYIDVTWETCMLRNWLNGYGAEGHKEGKDYSGDGFLNNAFTASERQAVKTTNVVNNNNPEHGTYGGKNTSDQVYLLSIEELRNPAYGFTSSTGSVNTRKAVNTAYTADGGEIGSSDMSSAGSTDHWWLRSPGYDNRVASYVTNIGYVLTSGLDVSDDRIAVRPALHLDLSSVSSWSYAGIVTSDGKEEGATTAKPGTPKPEQTPIPPTTAKPAFPTPQTTAEPETTHVPKVTYDLKLKTSGNGTVTLKISDTTVTTEGNATIDMTVDGGKDILLTFQPAEGSGPYTFTIDGEEKQAEGNNYRIPGIQSSHTIMVTFVESPQPTLEPTPTPAITLTPIPTTEPPGSMESSKPTEEPVPSTAPSSTKSPELSPSQKPESSPASTPEAFTTPLPDKNLSTITDGLGVSPDTAVKIQVAAKELDVSMDTILMTEQTIQSQKSDGDIKGAYFSRIQARASQITEKNIKLTWNRVKGADGYEVYGNRCNTKKWIYEYKLKRTIKNGNKKSYIDRSCRKGTYYKYIVRAYKIIDGKKVTIAASKTIHAITNGGKNGNAKSVKVNKNKIILKAGKIWRIKAKEIKQSKPLRHHREVSFESSRSQAVSVSKKGVIKAKKKGKCTIFAYAQSGVYKKVQVTVK
jgi:hypothetical protein